MVGIMLCHGTFRARDRSDESSFPKLLIKAPMGRFFFEKFFNGVAYEKIELKDGKDVEIYENLDFVNFDWHNRGNPTTL